MKKIKLKASSLKNIIKEIKRRIVLEGIGPLRGICMHRDEGETNPGEVVVSRACRTSESPSSGSIECITDEDCMGGGVWYPHHSAPNTPQFTLGGCYCDKSPVNGEAGGSTKTNTYVDRPGGEDASTGAIEENIKRGVLLEEMTCRQKYVACIQMAGGYGPMEDKCQEGWESCEGLSGSIVFDDGGYYEDEDYESAQTGGDPCDECENDCDCGSCEKGSCVNGCCAAGGRMSYYSSKRRVNETHLRRLIKRVIKNTTSR